MRQVITFTMKPETYRAMKERAEGLGMSQAQFIKTAIEREMKRTDKLAPKLNSIGGVGEMHEQQNNPE